jgi:two-component system sensor histidine kinase KdpD
MNRIRRFQGPLTPLLVPYIASLFVTAGAVMVLFSLRSHLNSSNIALLLLLPVGVSSMLWGLGPGILSSLSSFLSINYFFIPPYYSLEVNKSQDLIALAIFLIVSVVINQLAGRIQASLNSATAREHESTWLFELISAMSGLNDPQSIARALAEHAMLVFQPSCVQVSLEPVQGKEPLVVHLPEDLDLKDQKPAWVEPIQTARGLLGEIVIWRENPLLSTEERLLHAFSSQGGIAYERARLKHLETRAHILEESDRLKSSLLSSVSHELRTPLATIKASVSSLRSEPSIWDQKSRDVLLEAIEEETDHLNQLVGNLLDMSRIESGAIQPQRRWNELAEIVKNVLGQMRLETQHHHIANEVSKDLPLIPVDYVQMDRVFTNLINNSIKYSPVGSTIRICAKVKDDKTLLVQVTNQGPHVPEEHLTKIFDKFYRITAADRVTGTGLGLSICKGFIEAHGGTIWAENLPEGFAFNFTLPLTWEGVSPRVPIG